MQFPAVSGEDLTRRSLRFPEAFAGHPTFAIVAFDIAQRDTLASWLTFLDAEIRAGHARGWLFPVLPKPAKMMKGAVETMLRKAVTSPEAQASTVPLFLDVDAFASALAVTDRKEIAIFLLDQNAEVAARAAGAYDEAAGTVLRTRLRELA